MVYFSNSYEALEKSMWCYEHNTVPLIGEKDSDIAVYAAGKYASDSLISDPIALPRLLPYLRTRTKKLFSITPSFR